MGFSAVTSSEPLDRGLVAEVRRWRSTENADLGIEILSTRLPLPTETI